MKNDNSTYEGAYPHTENAPIKGVFVYSKKGCCDSLENGIVNTYNSVSSKIRSEYDMLLEEVDIDNIINGRPQYYNDRVVAALKQQVQDFVRDLLSSLRERV